LHKQAKEGLLFWQMAHNLLRLLPNHLQSALAVEAADQLIGPGRETEMALTDRVM
jgi:hypothetical protein